MLIMCVCYYGTVSIWRHSYNKECFILRIPNDSESGWYYMLHYILVRCITPLLRVSNINIFGRSFLGVYTKQKKTVFFGGEGWHKLYNEAGS